MGSRHGGTVCGGGIGEFFSGIWNGFGEVVKGAWNGIMGWLEGGINGVIGLINGLLQAMNGLSNVTGLRFGMLPMVHMPMLAEGGIVTGPTIAMIGEAGPEAVIPLSRGASYGVGRGGGSMVADVPVELRLDGQVLARTVKRVHLREGW